MFNKLTKALIESENNEIKEKELATATSTAQSLDNAERFCPKNDNDNFDALELNIMSTPDSELEKMPVDMQSEKLYNDAVEMLKE